MTKKYKIEGLDCPNCARALENELNKSQHIEKAKIEFVKSLVEIKAKDDSLALDDAIKITKEIEPDAKIIVKSENNSKKMFFVDIFFAYFWNFACNFDACT